MTMWVFGYGSLIWNSGFQVARSEIATLDGFARSFCMWSVHYRGTSEAPGLVLGLDHNPNAACCGMALAVAEGQEDETLAYLRERELTASAYEEQQVPLTLRSGEMVTAYTYVVDPAHELYCGGLSLEQQAGIISRAAGNRGPNADYLLNTVAHLGEIGIDDHDLCWLATRVKELVA
ncbi:MAG: gamma-glutamylcyclotransferase [Paracoccaceae bacterium]